MSSTTARFSTRPQRRKVILHQFHDEHLVANFAPTIALDAADKALSVVVDFTERTGAIGTLVQSSSPLAANGLGFRADPKRHAGISPVR
jgi:hypothetical protein